MSIVIRYQNARGLRTKIDEFSTNIINSEADIHKLTETWLNSDYHSSEYIMSNFISHRRDRNYSNTKTTMGGGCRLFHKNKLEITRRYDLESSIDFVEDLWVQVNLDNSDNHLFICSVYKCTSHQCPAMLTCMSHLPIESKIAYPNSTLLIDYSL